MSYVVHFRNRTELADPQALFTFIHPNRGECLKLILLSRIIWSNIWYEFDRNADRQQPLWSSKISYQMRFDASRFRWLFRNGSLQRCDAFHQSCYTLTWNVQLVSRSFPYSEPHQSEKGDNYCLVFIIEQLKRMSITFLFSLKSGRRSRDSLLALRQSHSRLVRMVRDETSSQCHSQSIGSVAQYWPLNVT